ncbi:MAG: hypothetical protein KAT33_02640 [Bacteroidales bacterium]|nr:hypothetical protein [Bacteroidales bacterium]
MPSASWRQAFPNGGKGILFEIFFSTSLTVCHDSNSPSPLGEGRNGGIISSIPDFFFQFCSVCGVKVKDFIVIFKNSFNR